MIALSRSVLTLLVVSSAALAVSAGASGGTQGASVSVTFGDRVSIAPTLQLGYAWR